jgi:hypothetical protein
LRNAPWCDAASKRGTLRLWKRVEDGSKDFVLVDPRWGEELCIRVTVGGIVVWRFVMMFPRGCFRPGFDQVRTAKLTDDVSERHLELNERNGVAGCGSIPRDCWHNMSAWGR